jgi:hypothetical protein
MVRLCWLAVVCACACFLTGCGGGDGPRPVSGTVTLDGQPLPSGEILFEYEDTSKSADGGQIKDGSFTFSAKPGKAKVTITAMREIPGKTVVGAMGEALPSTEQYLPAKYNTATELTAEVKAGSNRFEFPLVLN